MITGAGFVDLSAAKETVNQRLLIILNDEKIRDSAPTTTRSHEKGTCTDS